MNNIVDKIYSEVLEFLDRKGFVGQLKESLKTPEAERFARLNISRDGLDILDAVHCVFDKNRSRIFLEEIDKAVARDSTVIEAGVGTGLLSFLAAAKGAKVYAIELNPAILNLANEVKQHLVEKKLFPPENIQFVSGDATQCTPPQKADVIISENIYTGMFNEKQVQIMNHLIKFLNSNGKVIPAGLRSFIFLNQAIFPHPAKNKEVFIPSLEEGVVIPSNQLADEVEYDFLDFRNLTKTKVEKTITIPITTSGELNSLLIYSRVLMPSGREIGRFETTFLNGDIIIALQPPRAVQKGSVIRLKLAYTYGTRPDEATIEID